MPGLGFGKKICQWCQRHEAAKRAEAAGEEDTVQPVMAAPWQRREYALPLSITQILLGINIAVFVAMALAGISITDPTVPQLRRLGANFGPETFGGQWWRLVTSCFLHGGIIHLGFNMWCLWDIGAMAEGLYGPVTYLVLYMISGAAGMLLSATWHFGISSVGASGAIFGLAGALAASFYLGEFSMPRAAILGQARSLILFVGYNLVFGFMPGTHTDNACHLGGLVSGGIMGALIARKAPMREQWPQRTVILGAVLAAVIGGTLWAQHVYGFTSHIFLGREYLQQQQEPTKAVPEFQAAVRRVPRSLPAHYWLAESYREEHDFANAEAELKRIIAIDPKFTPAYYQLGWVYHDLKQREPERQVFSKLLELDPQSADAHLGLGVAAYDAQDYTTALAEYQSAAKLDPSLPDLYYNLGITYGRLGQWDNAIAALRRQLQLSGESSDVESALAEAYRAKGMTREAEEAEKKVVQKPSGSPPAQP